MAITQRLLQVQHMLIQIFQTKKVKKQLHIIKTITNQKNIHNYHKPQSQLTVQ